MDNIFCKVEDSNKNKYILTDKFKQPLLCHPKDNTCKKINLKKFIDFPVFLPTDTSDNGLII